MGVVAVSGKWGHGKHWRNSKTDTCLVARGYSVMGHAQS